MSKPRKMSEETKQRFAEMCADRGYRHHVERAKRLAQAEADNWNLEHPIGTPVRYWTWAREGPGKIGTVRGAAIVIGDCASAWVTGAAGCISLTHIEAIRED